jgi:hypothetical protein
MAQCEYVDKITGIRCSSQAIECHLPDWGPNKPEVQYYCGTHAQQQGFCSGCGEFWGGIDSFDFGDGLCDNCKDEFEDYYDDEEDWEETSDYYGDD